MKRPFQRIGLFTLLIAIPAVAFAHQPHITESRETYVSKPEISKAYYAKLTGAPDVYTIQSSIPFDLYVNVLVPDIPGQKKDISATIFKDGKQVAFLDGTRFEWKQFYEPFGADSYWMGPEYKASASAGDYEIEVSSSNNDSKYALAIGETETFNLPETLNALTLIPYLKRNFFDESPIGFIKSPFGWGLIVITYILAFATGLLYRFIVRRLSKSTPRDIRKNIGSADRLVRFAIAMVILLIAITTSWNPILLFVSGFALFEAIFSWCAFYAALGKNTCPAML